MQGSVQRDQRQSGAGVTNRMVTATHTVHTAGMTTTEGTRTGEVASGPTKPLGIVEAIPNERLMDVVTAVSGSGPAYVFLLAEVLAAAAEAEGLPADIAARLAQQTVAGSGALMLDSASPPATLRKQVTSPGGTTQAALDVLQSADGLGIVMRRAVQAATQRSRELGKGFDV